MSLDTKQKAKYRLLVKRLDPKHIPDFTRKINEHLQKKSNTSKKKSFFAKIKDFFV